MAAASGDRQVHGLSIQLLNVLGRASASRDQRDDRSGAELTPMFALCDMSNIEQILARLSAI
jgi:hypothetical protein